MDKNKRKKLEEEFNSDFHYAHLVGRINGTTLGVKTDKQKIEAYEDIKELLNLHEEIRQKIIDKILGDKNEY